MAWSFRVLVDHARTTIASAYLPYLDVCAACLALWTNRGEIRVPTSCARVSVWNGGRNNRTTDGTAVLTGWCSRTRQRCVQGCNFLITPWSYLLSVISPLPVGFELLSRPRVPLVISFIYLGSRVCCLFFYCVQIAIIWVGGVLEREARFKEEEEENKTGRGKSFYISSSPPLQLVSNGSFSCRVDLLTPLFIIWRRVYTRPGQLVMIPRLERTFRQCIAQVRWTRDTPHHRLLLVASSRRPLTTL